MTLNNRVFKGQRELKLLCCVTPVWMGFSCTLVLRIFWVCAKAALSSLQVEDSVSCIIFLVSFSMASTHTHTHRRSVSLCLRFQSPSPHKPTSLSFEPTYSISIGWHSGTSEQIAGRDISNISRNLTFMGLVFLPHFAWNTFGFRCPCITPDACREKFKILTELLPDFKKKKKDLNSSCGADQFSALRGDCRRNVHFHLHLTCTSPEAETYVCLHSQHRQTRETAKIATKSCCAAGASVKCFAGTRCLCFLWFIIR